MPSACGPQQRDRRPGGNGLVTLQLSARSRSAPFRNSFSAGIGEMEQDEL